MSAENGHRYNTIGRTIICMVALLLVVTSCGRKEKIFAEAVTSRDSMALMSTGGITSLISENGFIRYRITTEEWDIFDRATPPHWSFEKGVLLHVFDSVMQVTSMVRADTAYYYDQSELWELRGNVHAENEQSEEFDTDLLYWDQRSEKVYSDSWISVRQEKQVIHGMGFESNQDFTRYTIRHSDGIFPVEDR